MALEGAQLLRSLDTRRCESPGENREVPRGMLRLRYALTAALSLRERLVGQMTDKEEGVYTRIMKSPCICTTFRSLSRKLSAAYDAALAPVGLNIAQYAMLRRIEACQPVSLTDLGEALELERSTVGRNVKVLERTGLVVTSRSAVDQREAVVSLTDTAENLLTEAFPLWEGCQKETRKIVGLQLESLLRQLEQKL